MCQNEEINAAGYCRDAAGRCTVQKVGGALGSGCGDVGRCTVQEVGGRGWLGWGSK